VDRLWQENVDTPISCARLIDNITNGEKLIMSGENCQSCGQKDCYVMFYDKECWVSRSYQSERGKMLDLTSLEFAHLVFMLEGCKCEMCQRISVKLVKLQQQAGEP
jgi:hypothetical protein